MIRRSLPVLTVLVVVLAGVVPLGKAHALTPEEQVQLLQTLETICKRRSLPPGWKTRFVLDPQPAPDFVMKLMAVHAAAKFSFDLSHNEP